MSPAEDLWRLQRRYFVERGPDAWRTGEVPDYVTSNPFIAETYAQLIVALVRDRLRLSGAGAFADQPLHICELGGGAGRFAHHFLERFDAICAAQGVGPLPIRYVLTDFAEANLAHWRSHPSFARHLQSGRLDLARFDLMDPGELQLEVSGESIGPQTLAAPLVVIANYVFDSIPQDVFRIAGGRIWRAEMTVHRSRGHEGPADLLAAGACGWTYRPLDGDAYSAAEPALQALMGGYARSLRDTHVTVPAAALRALDRLSSFSRRGLMLLSADKGDCRLEALQGRGPPGFARHGSVSASVNFHALAQACVTGGGVALTPEAAPGHIAVVLLLTGPDATGHSEVAAAYRAQVDGFGPDAFYATARSVVERLQELRLQALLDFLEFSRHDARQFFRLAPRLIALGQDLTDGERDAVAEAIDRVWAGYFPIGEDDDLAAQMGRVLYALDRFAPALTYFERSAALHGGDSGTLFNMAACRFMLGQTEGCAALLERLVQADPDHREAALLLRACTGDEPAAAG